RDGYPIAAMTWDGSSLPLEHAEPVDTANPRLSSFTTQRCWESASGINAETVFHKRSCPAPTTSERGKSDSNRFSKDLRHSTRFLCSSVLNNASRASRAA